MRSGARWRACVALLLFAALAVTVGAQDTTLKSLTQIEADDAKVMSMSGCLRHDAATNSPPVTYGS